MEKLQADHQLTFFVHHFKRKKLWAGLPHPIWRCTMYIDNDCFKIQAALVIRGFVIHGFNYPWLVNLVQNLLSADISLGYPRIWSLINGQKAI